MSSVITSCSTSRVRAIERPRVRTIERPGVRAIERLELELYRKTCTVYRAIESLIGL